MAVLVPCTETDEGAYALIQPVYASLDGGAHNVSGFVAAPASGCYVRELHHGLVLSTGERNGYHDSDFTVTVWDPVKGEPDTFVYASTSYPTQHLWARVDAPESVVEAYQALSSYRLRRGGVMALRAASKARAEVSRKLGCRMSAIRRLEAGMGQKFAPVPSWETKQDIAIDRVIRLATSFIDNRLRSPFKKKLAEQVIAWLRDPSPQYRTPLSPRQLDFV